ncbi:MAG TPA: hypothetical protein VMV79_03635 [Alphaproteobacteria bacterium]|nr:hypothetical protein [Alphaproteobacteria bacterium]
MKNLTRCLALTAGLFLLACASAQADSNPVKMLPPTCPGVSAGVYGILSWNGVDPLGCTSGFTSDRNGNVSITGTVQIGSGSCTANGKLQWNGTAIQYCYNGKWQDLGGGGTVGVLHQNGGYDWSAQNWWVFSCDSGYTLVEHPVTNTNVAGHNTATEAFFQCVSTSYVNAHGCPYPGLCMKSF